MAKGARVEEYKLTPEMKTWINRAQSIERLKQVLKQRHQADNMQLMAMMQQQKASLPRIKTRQNPGMEE